MSQARGRQNGKAPRHKNTPRPNHFWECPECGMVVKGTQRQVDQTKKVHNCGMGGWNPWLSR